MSHKKRILAGCLVAALAVVLVACGGQNATPAAGGGADTRSGAPAPVRAETPKPDYKPAKIIIATPNSGSVSFAAVNVAMELGYFADEKLEVEYTQMTSSVAMKALTSGDIQFAVPLATGVASAAKGAPVKVIAALMNNTHSLMVNPNKVKQPSDLKGKNIAVSGKGDLTDIELQVFLKQNNVAYDSANVITLLGSARLAGAKSGQIDASVTSIPDDFLLEDVGFTRMVAFAKVFPTGTGGLVTSDKLLKEDPELVRRTVRALLRANKFLVDKQNEKQLAGILEKQLKLEPAIAARAAKVLPEFAVLDLEGPADLHKNSFDGARERDPEMPADISMDKIFDFRLVREVRGQLKH